jgi:hypothetical protein
MEAPNNGTKHPGGRKTVMTAETLAKLRNAFLMDCTEEEACFIAKIDHATLWRYKQSHPEFCKDIEACKKNPVLKARATIYKNLDNPKIAKWYLEHKAKDEFSTKQEIAVSNDSDKPLFYIPENGRPKTDH